MTIFTKFTHDEITEHFKSSTLCALTLINSDVIICNAKEFDNNIILFNPVLMEGYVDENQVFQYFFKPICIVSKDNFTIMGKDKIMYASTVDMSFRNDYIEYQKMKIQKQMEEKQEEILEETKESSNVVQIGKKQLH